MDRSLIPALLAVMLIPLTVAAFLTDGTLALVFIALAIVDAIAVWLLSPTGLR